MARPTRRPTRARTRRKDAPRAQANLPPGTPVFVGEASHGGPAHVAIWDYGNASARRHEAPTPAVLTRCRDNPTVTWVDVQGVHDVATVQEIARIFGLHPLWVEDLLNLGGRPKTEVLGDLVLVVARMLDVRRPEEGGAVEVRTETIGLVLGRGFVLSFQEDRGDVWDTVRARIRDGGGRIRHMPASYLLHALLDAVVDAWFHTLEQLDVAVDELEELALTEPDADVLARLAMLRTELNTVRGAVGPLRDAVAPLARGDTAIIPPEVTPFFRDLQDHVLQAVDAAESLRERAMGAVELHLAVAGQHLNEVMRVLTVVTTLFVPLTFIAGIYGMNFDHMPELHTPWGYPLVIALMVAMTVGMLGWFRRRNWL
jgi:magnesium transporter